MSLISGFFRPRAAAGVDPGFWANDGTSYLNVLNQIEDRCNPEIYLEIGSRDGRSLSHRSCSFVAIDPEFAVAHDVFNSSRFMLFAQESSDDFFASGALQKLDIKPDFAFVDGMHLFEFALRDFINCERAMHRDAVICLHDVAPYNHTMTIRDGEHLVKSGAPWTGDVWKVMAILKTYRADLTVELASASRTGLGVITGLSPNSTELAERYDEIVASFRDLTLESFGVERYFKLVGQRAPEDLSVFK